MSDEQEVFVNEACRPAVIVPADTIPKTVAVLHPGYTNGDNILFKLDAYTTDRQGRGCVLRELVEELCMGFTGNVEEGFINCSREPGAAKVTQHYLQAGKTYYFHLGRNQGIDPRAYAVVPFFRELPFRPEHVGAHWRDAVTKQERAERHVPDDCVMSGHQHANHDCHLVPESENEFWVRKNLDELAVQAGSQAVGRQTMNSSNMIRLDSGLHHAMDVQKAFWFYPVQGNISSYFVRRTTRLAAQYHTRGLRGGLEVTSPEYLYLRMMFNAFPIFQQQFLFRGSARNVKYRDGIDVVKTSLQLEAELKPQTESTSSRKRRSPDKSTSTRSQSQTNEETVTAENGERNDYGQGMKRKRIDEEPESDLDSGIVIYDDLDDFTKRKRESGDEWVRGRLWTRGQDEERSCIRIGRKEREAKEEQCKKELIKRLANG